MFCPASSSVDLCGFGAGGYCDYAIPQAGLQWNSGYLVYNGVYAACVFIVRVGGKHLQFEVPFAAKPAAIPLFSHRDLF